MKNVGARADLAKWLDLLETFRVMKANPLLYRLPEIKRTPLDVSARHADKGYSFYCCICYSLHTAASAVLLCSVMLFTPCFYSRLYTGLEPMSQAQLSCTKHYSQCLHTQTCHIVDHMPL